MKIYKLIPEKFEERRRGAMKRVGWIMILIPAVVTAFTAHYAYQRDGEFGWREIGIYGSVGVFCTGLILWGLFKGFDRAQRTWNAYQIILDGDRIIRKEPELPDLELHRTEITQVVCMPGDRLKIETSDPKRFLAIPEGLEEFEELANFLPIWASVETKTEPSRQWLSGVVVGGTLIAFLTMMFGRHPAVVSSGALLLIGTQFWAATAIRRSPLYPTKTKRNYTLMCIYMTLLAVLRLVTLFAMS